MLLRAPRCLPFESALHACQILQMNPRSLTLALALASCGGGGDAVAPPVALALRVSPTGLDLTESLISRSMGTALASDVLLGGFLLQTGGTASAFHLQLDSQGGVQGGHRADVPFAVASALNASRIEHRGSRVVSTSPLHVWGGVRDEDGGWCAFLDPTAGSSILDTVLFANGGVGVLIYASGPGVGEYRLTYEELLPDGTPSFALELPGPFLSGASPSIGLVARPDGIEYPVIAALKDSSVLTWIGILNRSSGGLETYTTTTVSSPTGVTDLEVVDAPGSTLTWVVGQRVVNSVGALEATAIRTVDDQGDPLPGDPEVESSALLGVAAATDYAGFDLEGVLHGQSVLGAGSEALFFSGTTEDIANATDQPAWFGWERGAAASSWIRIAVDVTGFAGVGSVLLSPSAQPGKVLAACSVANQGAGITSLVAEFDGVTGELSGGTYYDTEFLVQELQASGSGIALSRIGGVPATSQVEWVHGDLSPGFTGELLDGAGDALPEFENPQRAYPELGLVAGGSDQGIYLISILDPLARSRASDIFAESDPLLGPQQAFFSDLSAVVALDMLVAPLGLETPGGLAPKLVPSPPLQLTFSATDL